MTDQNSRHLQCKHERVTTFDTCPSVTVCDDCGKKMPRAGACPPHEPHPGGRFMSNPPQARCVKCGDLYQVCPDCDTPLTGGRGKAWLCPACGWTR